MTHADILCFNHGMVYQSGHGAEEGDMRIEVCTNALHRYFSYYGNIGDPHFVAWIYDNSDIQTAKKKAFEVKKKCKSFKSQTLDNFFEDRKFIIEMGYHPEFFQTMKPWYNIFLEEFRHIKPPKKQLQSVEELLSIITLEKNPYDPEDNMIKEAERAKERTQACIDLQFVDRDEEGEVLGAISQFQNSSILEQQWLAFIALRYYLLGGISNYNYLRALVKETSLDQRFIIRQESFDATNSLFVTQPELGLELVEEFLSSKNQIHQFYGLRFVAEYEAYMFQTFGNGHRWNDFEKRQIKPKKKLVQKYKTLVEQSKDIIVELFEKLVKTETYWKYDESSLKGFEKLKEDYKTTDIPVSIIYRLQRWLSKPFKYKNE
ncbi:MAG: hypothetical protein FK733_04840 [Asgard group archaeon]|nr:hypothetical protein [Asgard group archaeon]